MSKPDVRIYKAPDGKGYPVEEAPYNMAFTVQRKDFKKGKRNDPGWCAEALAIRRMENVLDVWVGSGKDAYVIFGPTDAKPYAHALHFTIPIRSERLRDAFDTDGTLKRQELHLRRPTAGRTLDARSKLNKERRKAIKRGSPIKKRDRVARPRIVRLGVEQRERAKITSKTVEVPQLAAEV